MRHAIWLENLYQVDFDTWGEGVSNKSNLKFLSKRNVINVKLCHLSIFKTHTSFLIQN